MPDYKAMTSLELLKLADKSNTIIEGAVGEGFKRLFAYEAAAVKPPVVLPPIEKPGMDASQIIAHIESVCPQRADQDADRAFTLPRYGEVPKNPDWWLGDGDKLFNARMRALESIEAEGNYTQSGLNSKKKNGKYQHVDSLKLEWVTVEECRKWAMRLFGIRAGFEVADSVIRRVQDEHGAYLSTCGGGSESQFTAAFYNTLFIDIAGQAAQIVQRDQFSQPKPGYDYSHETPDYEADMSPGLPILFERVSAINVSQPGGGRQSFNFSLFGGRHQVEMIEMFIDNRGQDESRGFMLCQGYEGTGDPYKRGFDLDTFAFYSDRSAQQAMNFEKMSRVSIKNGVIGLPNGSNNLITINEECDWSFENVTSLNQSEKVRVRIGDVDAGTVDELSGAS